MTSKSNGTSKRKKALIFLGATAIVVIAVFAVLAFLAFGTVSVYDETSPLGDVKIQIRRGTGYFDFTPRGVHEYELVVSRKDFLYVPIMKKDFIFNADGAPLKNECVQVDWFDDKVEIAVDNKQNQTNSVKRFVCYF